MLANFTKRRKSAKFYWLFLPKSTGFDKFPTVSLADFRLFIFLAKEIGDFGLECWQVWTKCENRPNFIGSSGRNLPILPNFRPFLWRIFAYSPFLPKKSAISAWNVGKFGRNAKIGQIQDKFLPRPAFHSQIQNKNRRFDSEFCQISPVLSFLSIRLLPAFSIVVPANASSSCACSFYLKYFTAEANICMSNSPDTF